MPAAIKQPAKQENMLLNVLFNIILPTVILFKFSSDSYLGTKLALIVALSFPLAYGSLDYFKDKKTNLFSIIGFVSICLTGGIGLLELDAKYLAIKEAAIPLVLGIGCLLSIKTNYPLIKVLLYNKNFFSIALIEHKIDENNSRLEFESSLVTSSWMLSSSFFLSSILNYGLARWIVTAPSGTELFNQQLGKMTALSFPVIAIPGMLFMFLVLLYQLKKLKKCTQLGWEELLNHQK